MHKPLLFTDMEGTLLRKVSSTSTGNTSPSIWSSIPQLLGPDAEAACEEGKRMWTSGEFRNLTTWTHFCLDIFRNHGLTQAQFNQVLGAGEYNPGVVDTIRELRTRYVTILISGGFKNQADLVQRELRLDHALSACELFWNEDGTLDHYNLLPCDYQGKVHFMRILADEYHTRLEDCLFIGDGKNDVHLAEVVGTSISFNGPTELQQVSTHSIHQPDDSIDFRAVLQYI